LSETLITGLKELTDKLEEMPDKMLRSALRAAARAAANEVKAAIKAAAPVDTGTLQKAIKIKVGRGTKNTVVFNVKTGVYKKFTQQGTGAPRHVNYGKQIEFGNSKRAAKPFIRPVFDSIGEQVLEAAIDKIKARVILYNNSRGGQGFE
jgi:HK97 gp10 family phage protein